MAGSLKHFVYQTSDDRVFAVFMDESNGELVGNQDMQAINDGDLDLLPKNIKPRYALYRSTDGKRQRKIIICDRSASIADITSSFTVPAADGNPASVMVLTSLIGERQTRIPTSRDTGLDDGDDT